MYFSSSISTWVKNTEALDLPTQEEEALDDFIDQMYEDLDRGTTFFKNKNRT